MIRLREFALAVCLIGLCISSEAQQNQDELRQRFLQAEQSSAQGRIQAYEALASGLKDYVLYPYLQYQHLQRRLDQDEAVVQFINDYAQTRYAKLLKQQWLIRKGQQQQWSTVLAHGYASDDANLSCYWGLANFYGNQAPVAKSIAQRWAASGQNLPSACEQLIALWPLSDDQLQQRWQAALLQEHWTLSEQLLQRLPAEHHHSAHIWLGLAQHPSSLVQADSGFLLQNPVLLAYTIQRWIDKQPLEAVAWWDAFAEKAHLPIEQRQSIEQSAALALALRHDPRAYSRLAALDNSDTTVNEWRLRAALLDQHWVEVLNAWKQMPVELQNQDKWQYWRARALVATGQPAAANMLYQSLALQNSFYGLMANLQLGQAIRLINQPLQVSEQAIQTLQQQPAFQAVVELRALDRRLEANRQWWFAVQNLDQAGLKVAAKLAQAWHWSPMAIATVAKAQDYGDLELRYPLDFQPVIQHCAEQNQLDPALLFGVIRQESAFDAQAESLAGAKGLMQLLPATAKEMARQQGIKHVNDNELWQTERTICFGGRYLKQLINQFNGQIAPALAAYNAGAKHSQQWRVQNQSLPMDIWVESIPYKETRHYVSVVIHNLMVYQQRLGRQGITPQRWLEIIH